GVWGGAGRTFLQKGFPAPPQVYYLFSASSISVRTAKPVPPAGQLGILRVTNPGPAMSRCAQLPSNVMNCLRNTAALLAPPARAPALAKSAVSLLSSSK